MKSRRGRRLSVPRIRSRDRLVVIDILEVDVQSQGRPPGRGWIKHGRTVEDRGADEAFLGLASRPEVTGLVSDSCGLDGPSFENLMHLRVQTFCRSRNRWRKHRRTAGTGPGNYAQDAEVARQPLDPARQSF